MRLSDLKIAHRLALGFGALIATLLVFAALGAWLSHRQAALTAKTIDVDVQQALHILGARAEINELRRFEKDMLLSLPDVERVRAYAQKWAESRASVLDHLNAAEMLAESQAERDVLRELGAALGRYERGMDGVRADAERGLLRSAAEGYKRVAEFREAVRAVDERMDVLFQSSRQQVEAIKPALAQTERQRRVVVLSGIAVGIAMALGIAFAIARSITRPVRYAVQVAEALARGDLAQKVEVRSRDELGRLMESMRGTAAQLGGIVARIKAASDKVSGASREIAQANLDLSTRTEEQASALEETSASLQQMTATVAQNAQNARDANRVAAQAAGVAAHGGELVRTAVGTMNDLSAASRKIAEITGVIDGIAFQTNILALNAAVEAARAGDQGRGFAVVAAEVRSLAQRSAGAAKEIKQVIAGSVAQVEAGSRQVNEAGRTMEEIVASVNRVSGLIAEITKASEEQAQGIEQASEAMTQLEQVTQQNAAMVEEASAAAGSLAEQAAGMSGAVAVFRIEAAALAAFREEAAPSRPAAVPVRRPATKALAQPAEEGWREF